MTLTPDQLAAIDRHLRKDNWLLNEALLAELTDHYTNAILDRMAQGMTFESALLDVHKEFGYRKGLLKMEEEYGKTQAKSSIRFGHQQFKSYFRRPRLPWTVAILAVVYALTLWITRSGTTLFAVDSWSFVAMMTLGGLIYVTAFYKLVKAEPSTLVHPGIFLGQGAILLTALSFFVRIFLPVESVASNYPFLFSVLVTLVIVYEAASFEGVIQAWHQQRRKTA
jgi:hypothetical protein